MWYVIDMFIGALIIAAILHFTKKAPVETEQVIESES